MTAARIGIDAPDALLRGDAVAWAIGRLAGAVRPLGIEVVTGVNVDAELVLSLVDETVAPDSYKFAVTDRGAALRGTIAASDPRGFAYALTEVAQRIAAAGGIEGIRVGTDETHVAAAAVRGICRAFSNGHHDLPWFRDRSFWPAYLDHLAMQRFNRFHLALGMHYNYNGGRLGPFAPQRVTDNYLCFAYPFLVDVPGFKVRAQGVSDEDRDRNLAALDYIARETRRRGMSFQLGLWNHAYDYGPGSDHSHPILGIGEESHAEYSAAGVAQLLAAVPDIDGLTFRVHYEGGIPDAGHEVFWEKVFQAVSDAGRPIAVDLHAKGVDRAILDAAAKPNISATLSMKWAAEHMGLPYHQAAIRPYEAAIPVRPGYELMGTAEFTRRFTRYGYADFMSEDRDVDVAFRLWPGTQRLLLWGDPAFASGYGRFSTFAGATGVEFSEPLYYKGRKGSGVAGGRDPYVDDDLRTGVDDWRKYLYTYVLWGRLSYDPDAEPETWQRELRAEYGAAAGDMEHALAALSRILPLVTMAHMPSPSNNNYWPEVYHDLPISASVHAHLYAHDTPNPTNWGHALPLDPIMFYGVDEYAADALAGTLTGKFTPLEVAAWLDRLVAEGESALTRARNALDPSDPQGRRATIDLQVLACLGRFFADKFRAAVEYSLYERTGDADLLGAAIHLVEAAHASYAAIVDVAGVYQHQLAFGDRATESGHWSDRLAAMADDLRALRSEHQRATTRSVPSVALERRADRWRLAGAALETPDAFRRGEPLTVRLTAAESSAISGAVLRYRRVDQSEAFRDVEMLADRGGFAGIVPADYTDTTFPLMYFVEVRRNGEHPIVVPGLDDTLSNQPYVLIHSTEWASNR